MKILSNYRDYYDHCAHQYGGGDPKIVYLRPHKHPGKDIHIKFSYRWTDRKYIATLNGKNINHKCISSIQNLYNRINKNEYYWRNGKIVYVGEIRPDIKGVVIGDKFFAFIKTTYDKDYRFVVEKDLENDEAKPWDNKIDINKLINHQDETLVELCRYVNLPVFSFTVNKEDTIKIDVDMPNLGKLGIPKYIPDYMMYQNLSYFIGNLMKISPDMMPEIKVTDRDKIVGHGFDLKTSFRKVK